MKKIICKKLNQNKNSEVILDLLNMERIKWIDIMKGIGILSVVGGHTLGGKISEIIYLYHMPLFFFIGGYLFNPKSNLKVYFQDKLRHLLIPYSLFLLIIYFSFCVPWVHISQLTKKETLAIFLLRPIFGRSFIGDKYDLGGYLAVFWFPTCFFLVQQLFNTILKKVTQINYISFIVIIMLFISYYNAIFKPNFKLPWGMNSVFAALPIFYIGYLYKKKQINTNWLGLAFLSVLVIANTFFTDKNKYDMAKLYYGIPLITLVSSLILILLIKKVSIWISQFKFLSLPLIEFGKASMIIMYVHQTIQIMAAKYIVNNSIFLFVFASICSLLIYYAVSKFTITRALLLGV